MTARSLFQTALALAVSLAVGCQKKPDASGTAGKGGGPVPVNIGEAVKKDMPLDLRAIGNVEPVATVDVKAQVGGELIEVNFKEEQDVKKGDLQQLAADLRLDLDGRHRLDIADGAEIERHVFSHRLADVDRHRPAAPARCPGGVGLFLAARQREGEYEGSLKNEACSHVVRSVLRSSSGAPAK